MEIQKLLDMNFEDKYVIVEFENGGKFRICRYFYQVQSILRIIGSRSTYTSAEMKVTKFGYDWFSVLDDLSASIQEEAKKWQGDAPPAANRYIRCQG